jgi:purine-nucleoside phosphorylase
MAGSSRWQDAADRLLAVAGGRPDLAVILGSGLGDALTCAEIVYSIPYQNIPGFPMTTVAGHAGRLSIGRLADWTVWFFSGRMHLYEGHTAATVCAPVELASAAGATRLFLSNAAGALSSDWPPGTMMWIEDHLNFMGDNPLRGVRTDPFIDLSHVYRNELYPLLRKALGASASDLRRGVLAALSGPSYETPAEIRALRRLGADAVSMSTVPEAIMACYLKMDVVGLSFIANAAAGVNASPLNHQHVLSEARGGASRLAMLLPILVPLWEKITPRS